MEKSISRSWACKKYKNTMAIAKCELCGSKRELEVHHIIPVKLGGDNSFDNLICVCSSCHAKLTPKRLLRRIGHNDLLTTKLNYAKRMVVEFLRENNEVDITIGTLDAAMMDAGIACATLRRAKQDLSRAGKIVISNSGYGKNKKWFIKAA